MIFLSVEKLSQTVNRKQLLFGISFSVKLGQIVALLGPNGAGKTTLLRTVIGLLRTPTAQKDSNQVSLDGVLINDWPVYKRVQAGLVYLPQSTSLFQQLTVQENLELVYEHQAFWQASTHEAFDAECNKWITRVDLQGALRQKATTLSGGQKRKLEVIRALLMHPKLIMLDEPFAGVDPKSIYELNAIFSEIAKSGIGVVISDHNVDQLFSLADFVYVVMHGKIVVSGQTKDILQDDYTKQSYLGDQFYQEMARKFL